MTFERRNVVASVTACLVFVAAIASAQNRAPTVASVNFPGNGSIVVSGDGFGPAPVVSFGGLNLSDALVNGLGTEIVATAPALAPGSYLLVVQSGNNRSTEFEVALGVQGPTGPTGPMGAQGLPGAAGTQGPKGETGSTGAQGSAGANGEVGATGPAGPIGPAGANGAIGPAGPAGANGAIGPAGPAGANGAIGPAGPAGANGAIGPAGPAGANGAIGPAGPAGANGAVGPTGPAGVNGPQGAIGPRGPAGPQGPAGPAGSGGYAWCSGGGTVRTNGSQDFPCIVSSKGARQTYSCHLDLPSGAQIEEILFYGSDFSATGYIEAAVWRQFSSSFGLEYFSSFAGVWQNSGVAAVPNQTNFPIFLDSSPPHTVDASFRYVIGFALEGAEGMVNAYGPRVRFTASGVTSYKGITANSCVVQ